MATADGGAPPAGCVRPRLANPGRAQGRAWARRRPWPRKPRLPGCRREPPTIPAGDRVRPGPWLRQAVGGRRSQGRSPHPTLAGLAAAAPSPRQHQQSSADAAGAPRRGGPMPPAPQARPQPDWPQSSRRIQLIQSAEICFGQTASHSSWLPQLPKPSACIAACIARARWRRSGCP